MDLNGNTKTEKNPEQVQSPGPQESARQAEEPGNMQAESPRKCKLCGGPNHHGCGCEAKAAAAAVAAGLSESEAAGLSESKAPAAGPPESEAPAAETKKPATALEFMIEELFSHFSKLDIEKVLTGEFDLLKSINKLGERLDVLCVNFYDTNNYLKLITGDLITIRKFLTKEDEAVEDPR